MCHGAAIDYFPRSGKQIRFTDGISGYKLGKSGGRKLAILPDIYGCNPFYFGLCSYLAGKGASVYLVDPFAQFGELPENTREAAYERRHKLADKAFIDEFESFCQRQSIDAVVGFCLGGLYVFELARRGLEADLIGLYGFPQGMPNKDQLPIPFDYLEDVTQPFTMLMGSEDAPVGPENVKRLADLQAQVPAMTLEVYEGVGHGFLPLLDSVVESERAIALHALARIERVAV